jgi:hypothetical protein
VYEAKSQIPAGSIITKDNLNYVKSYSNQAQDYFMTEDNIGMMTLIQIDAGTPILKGMLTQNSIDDNVREVEYNTFSINSNIKENEYIDVRIQFPNGEDYIVLSKKSIKQVNLDTNNCFLWLTEEEILNMSGAMVDAFLYAGSKLYTTKYIEPNLQEASIPTYHPSKDTLTLMEEDKNIVDRASQKLNKLLREELENRLKIKTAPESLERDLQNQSDSLEDDGYYIESDETIKEQEVIVEYGG